MGGRWRGRVARSRQALSADGWRYRPSRIHPTVEADRKVRRLHSADRRRQRRPGRRRFRRSAAGKLSRSAHPAAAAALSHPLESARPGQRVRDGLQAWSRQGSVSASRQNTAGPASGPGRRVVRCLREARARNGVARLNQDQPVAPAARLRNSRLRILPAPETGSSATHSRLRGAL